MFIIYMPAANGTACTDFDSTTVGDVCRGGVCVGTPATCGNQNVTSCPPNQRLNYMRRCAPGSNCTVAACCRACVVTNLVKDGEFGNPIPPAWSSSGWTVGIPSYGGFDVFSAVNGATISQAVCICIVVSHCKCLFEWAVQDACIHG
jgi:hypothetical protein